MGIDERIHEDQLVDDVGVGRSHGQRDGAPHRVAAERDAPEAERRDEVDEGLAERIEVVSIAARRRLLALAEAR